MKNKKRNSKIYIIFKIILSFILALSIVLDHLVVYSGNLFGTLKENYIQQFKLTDIFVLLLYFILFFLIISIIEIIAYKYLGLTDKKRCKSKFKILFITLGIILLCWAPYYLSYFPGGIFSDTTNSLAQAIGVMEFNNHNPILYSLILKVFIFIGGNIQRGMELFTIFQVLGMAVSLAYFVQWLYNKNVKMSYIILVIIYFSLFNLFPLYAVSIWKDTPFSIVLFLYTIELANIILSKGKTLSNIKTIIIYLLLASLVILLRNNGIYIVTVITLVLIIGYNKALKKQIKLFKISAISCLLALVFIEGPVFNYMNMNTEFVENLGVLIQQIGYVTSSEGKISNKEKEVINNIIPITILKENYTPLIVDSIKWHESFNNQYLEEHKKEFFKTWFTIFLKNPRQYIDAYLLNTLGFWNMNKEDFAGAYVNPTMWGGTDNVSNVYQKDLIYNIFNHSIREYIYPKKALNSAFFLYLTLVALLFVIKKQSYKKIIIFLPSLLTWLTIMVAVPLAFSFRYTYILILNLPLLFIIQVLKEK